MMRTVKNSSLATGLMSACALLVLAALLVLVLPSFMGLWNSKASFAQAQSSNLGSLSGYAWSDNLGWISFNGSTYQVVVQSDGTLAGYAWANPSDDADGVCSSGNLGTCNIGWISFNAADTASCGTVATLSGTTITGWAKVIGADNNGWNGCISLSGSAPAYGVTLNSTGSSQSGLLDGYAWGDSTVGGWISFNCDTGGPTGNNICATSNYAVQYTTNAPPPQPLSIQSFYGSPLRVNSGETATLKYTVISPPASCTITGTNGFSTTVSPTDGVEGSVATNVITANTNFTLTCGTASATAAIGVVPKFIEQ